MKKLLIGTLVSIMMLTSCGETLKEYWVHYKTNDSEHAIGTYFYGRTDSYLIHFENDSNLYRLVVVDTLKKRKYYFDSPTPIKIVKTNITIEGEY